MLILTWNKKIVLFFTAVRHFVKKYLYISHPKTGEYTTFCIEESVKSLEFVIITKTSEKTDKSLTKV